MPISRIGAARVPRRYAGLLTSRVKKGDRGKYIQVETSGGDLNATLQQCIVVRARVKDVTRLIDRRLLWLNEHEIVTLGKGLTVNRRAISTLHLECVQ